MNRPITLLVLSVLHFAAVPGASPDSVLSAQDGASSATKSAEARWRGLTDEQQALVRERFREWKAMEPEQRHAVEVHHDALRSVKQRVLAELPEAERNRIAALDARERKRAFRPHLKQHFQSLRDELQQSFGAGVADKRTLREVRRALRDRTGDRLAELEEAGVLPPGESERLLSLSPWEFGPELRRLTRLAVLADPPKEILMLPEDQRERLLALPPDAFLKELAALRSRGNGKENRGKSRLPRAFRDAVERRPGKERSLSRDVLRQVFSADEMAELEAMDATRRPDRIHELLRTKARAAVEQGGAGLGAWEKVESLPRPLQQRRYLKLIDPTIDPRARRGDRIRRRN